jgi:hypothetical protein
MGDAMKPAKGKGGESDTPRVLCALVVGENPDFCNSVKSTLRSIRWVEIVVETANSPSVAIQWISAGYAPDVIFCDLDSSEARAGAFFDWVITAHPEWMGRICVMKEGDEDPTLVDDLKGRGCRIIEKGCGQDRIWETLATIVKSGA